MQVNIHEAKTNFSKLVARANRGEEIIIAKAGRPLVKLVAITPPAKPRKSGSAKGMLSMSDDFNAPLPDELLNSFYQ